MIALKYVAVKIGEPGVYVGEIREGQLCLTRCPSLARSYAPGETPPEGFRMGSLAYRVCHEPRESWG